MTSAVAGADRLLGQPPRLVGVEALVVVGGDADDRAPLGLEPRQVRGLVLVPLAEDEVAVRDVEVRLLELAARDASESVVRCGQARWAERSDGESEQRAVANRRIP